MQDERVLAIREKVFEVFAIAKSNFQSADILYEAKKYRASIPLFKNSVLCGIKAILMLSLDDLPDDSHLVNSYYQTEISKELELDIRLNEVLEKLKNAEQDSIDHPLKISKKSIKDLDICDKQIENFLAKANRLIKKTVLTTNEIKKKRVVRKLTITISVGVATIFILAKIILTIIINGNGLIGRYFADQNFEKLIKTRTDKKIDFDWGNGNIINNYSDNVYIRWTGKIKTQRIGHYYFITKSDDGVRVWIDDKLIIDDWREYGATYCREKIYLEKGYHWIKIEYFEGRIYASIKLIWIIPGTLKPKVISPFYFKHVERLD